MSPAIRRYQPDARPPLATADQFVVVIPAGISKTSDLLAMLAAQLHFPAWFGCNWNALSDCLPAVVRARRFHSMIRNFFLCPPPRLRQVVRP